MPWPRPYVYEHPICVGRVDLERRRRDEDWTLFATVTAPEMRTLTDIHGCLASLQSDSLETVKPWRSQITLSHYPSLIRRAALWVALNRSGHHRCDRFGTFRLVSAAGAGAVSIPSVSGAPITVSYGPIDDQGHVKLMLVFDQRLHSDSSAASCLDELEQTLNGPISEELASLLVSVDHPQAIRPRRAA